jgi:hypothetical protein
MQDTMYNFHRPPFSRVITHHSSSPSSTKACLPFPPSSLSLTGVGGSTTVSGTLTGSETGFFPSATLPSAAFVVAGIGVPEKLHVGVGTRGAVLDAVDGTGSLNG